MVLAVCVTVALASDSRTEKQIAYVNTYGQVAGKHIILSCLDTT